MSYHPTIGLEVHAELKTRTKMFCDSRNDPEEETPNVNVCPICLAHPGTLPVINGDAVMHVLRLGAAIGATLADYSEFDRKSYFYPDIPKGYQISQYLYPLVSHGALNGVEITRVHLEEDTARSTHASGASLVDFNRAGIPLMELVTEPVITSPEEAGAFARELQLLLRTLGASDANLEKGEMRIEANVSVSKEKGVFGTKVEVKNINSFRSVERAIAFEIDRQSALIESGGKVVQETRGWDETKQSTFHQRFKEGSADYRYFPEPDLPKLRLASTPSYSVSAIRATLPELPWARRTRYEKDYSLKGTDVAYLCATKERSDFFDAVAGALADDRALMKVAANYIVSDLAGIYTKQGSENLADIDPRAFASLVRLVSSGTLSSRGAKDVLAILVSEGGDPERIAAAHNLLQSHDSDALRAVAKAVISEESTAVAEYRAGKEAALQYLVGKSMKAAKGSGNPDLLRKILTDELKAAS